MNPTNHIASQLPEDLQLVPAQVWRKQGGIPETTLWRLEKAGKLHGVRIGRRRYYRLSDLRAFIKQAAEASPIEVPWNKRKPAAEPEAGC